MRLHIEFKPDSEPLFFQKKTKENLLAIQENLKNNQRLSAKSVSSAFHSSHSKLFKDGFPIHQGMTV
jgi:hypothetical protein